MYRAFLDDLLALYPEGVKATGDEAVLVISSGPLGAVATDAIAKSLAALGYGNSNAGFIELNDELGAFDVRTLVEGLDPLALIITDAAAIDIVAAGYNMGLPHVGHRRLLGRDVVLIDHLETSLTTSDGKQRVWALLKKLPRT